MEAALARRPRRQPLLLGPFKGAIEEGTEKPFKLGRLLDY